MNLTKEQVKQIIAQVHKDLNLEHDNKYPILTNFIHKNDEYNDWKFDYWGGGYDYSDPEAVGDEWLRSPGSEWLITIDDAKGEAIAIHSYTGHYEIALNKEGKYEIVKQMYRNK
ncbi:hypothetical protein [Apibacter sp. HY039]|uniref:hypothetical protein n=1 Tax=Apibacter sp. HY039 TaxID=2501476 RepID=UPI000FEBD017|nr:hypothetical protein [Apibacter sp. HY039]